MDAQMGVGHRIQGRFGVMGGKKRPVAAQRFELLQQRHGKAVRDRHGAKAT
jgi:hypothetical protein